MAENEATFRDANERIKSRALELDFEERIPLLCECGEPSCREIVRLELAEYERVRRDGASFIVLPGHEIVAGAYGRVVERGDRYLVVEKLGSAGEVAEARDPRAPETAS